MSTIDENSARIYTVNLGKAWLTPQYKRTDRVVNMIREFARKHMKSKEVKLDQELNRHVWERGRTNPPRRLRVRMAKDENGIVVVSLYEESIGKTKSADAKLKENQSSEQENNNKEVEEKEGDLTNEIKQEEIKEHEKRPKEEKPEKRRKRKNKKS
jgi:large subunit ribosomal protein L31e